MNQPKVLDLAQTPTPRHEDRLFAFDFGTRAEILAGASLTGTPQIEVSPNDGTLTIGTPTIVGTQVQVEITGGQAKIYKLWCHCAITGPGARKLVVRGLLNCHT